LWLFRVVTGPASGTGRAMTLELADHGMGEL
jgi:NAD(P)-dependent dehydrogenase (short-subunit alcohol dehydrogenase family)